MKNNIEYVSYVVHWSYVDTSYWDDGNRTKRCRRECKDWKHVEKTIEEIRRWAADEEIELKQAKTKEDALKAIKLHLNLA